MNNAPHGSFSMDASTEAVGKAEELPEEDRIWAKVGAVLGISDSILREALETVAGELGPEDAAFFENAIRSTRINRAKAAVDALRALGLEHDPEAKKRPGPFGSARSGSAENRKKEEE